MVISLFEILDMVIMTLIVGFIFMDLFLRYSKDKKQAFLFSILSVAPAIIFHELGHKFVAMAFGFTAVFNAAYTWLGIGLIMKFLAGWIFFVPAYVSIQCAGDCVIAPGVSALISFAGPGVNLLIYAGSWAVQKYTKLSPKSTIILVATKKINGLLFIFNMLPIPLFDGFKVYSGIWGMLF